MALIYYNSDKESLPNVLLPKKLENLPKSLELPKIRHRWNTNEEIASLLTTFDKHNTWQTTVTKTRPHSGCLFLFNRKKVKHRKDGYIWKKRKDGKTTREDHMKLKVLGVECLYGCYVHSAIIPTFHRRCYWLLQNPDMVLVHYLNMPADDSKGGAIHLGRWMPTTLPLTIDGKTWTREELLQQITPMFVGSQMKVNNGNKEYSGTDVAEAIVHYYLMQQSNELVSKEKVEEQQELARPLRVLLPRIDQQVSGGSGTQTAYQVIPCHVASGHTGPTILKIVNQTGDQVSSSDNQVLEFDQSLQSNLILVACNNQSLMTSTNGLMQTATKSSTPTPSQSTSSQNQPDNKEQLPSGSKVRIEPPRITAEVSQELKEMVDNDPKLHTCKNRFQDQPKNYQNVMKVPTDLAKHLQSITNTGKSKEENTTSVQPESQATAESQQIKNVQPITNVQQTTNFQQTVNAQHITNVHDTVNTLKTINTQQTINSQQTINAQQTINTLQTINDPQTTNNQQTISAQQTLNTQKNTNSLETINQTMNAHQTIRNMTYHSIQENQVPCQNLQASGMPLGNVVYNGSVGTHQVSAHRSNLRPTNDLINQSGLTNPITSSSLLSVQEEVQPTCPSVLNTHQHHQLQEHQQNSQNLSAFTAAFNHFQQLDQNAQNVSTLSQPQNNFILENQPCVIQSRLNQIDLIPGSQFENPASVSNQVNSALTQTVQHQQKTSQAEEFLPMNSSNSQCNLHQTVQNQFSFNHNIDFACTNQFVNRQLGLTQFLMNQNQFEIPSQQLSEAIPMPGSNVVTNLEKALTQSQNNQTVVNEQSVNQTNQCYLNNSMSPNLVGLLSKPIPFPPQSTGTFPAANSSPLLTSSAQTSCNNICPTTSSTPINLLSSPELDLDTFDLFDNISTSDDDITFDKQSSLSRISDNSMSFTNQASAAQSISNTSTSLANSTVSQVEMNASLADATSTDVPVQLGVNSSLVEITDYSPGWSYSEGGIKILVTGPWTNQNGIYTCLFDELIVSAALIQAGVLRCFCPAHTAGLVVLRVALDSVPVSRPVLFEYKARNMPRPSGQQDWLSLDENQFKMAILDRLEQIEKRLGCSTGLGQQMQQARQKDDASETSAQASFQDRVVAICEKLIACSHQENLQLKMPSSWRGMTLLHLASALGYSKLMLTLHNWRKNKPSLIIESEANPMLVDDNMCTPMMWSCALGNTQSALLLYHWNQQCLTVSDSLGRLPLQLARSRGHASLVQQVEQVQHQLQQTVTSTINNSCPPMVSIISSSPTSDASQNCDGSLMTFESPSPSSGCLSARSFTPLSPGLGSPASVPNSFLSGSRSPLSFTSTSPRGHAYLNEQQENPNVQFFSGICSENLLSCHSEPSQDNIRRFFNDGRDSPMQMGEGEGHSNRDQACLNESILLPFGSPSSSDVVFEKEQYLSLAEQIIDALPDRIKGNLPEHSTSMQNDAGVNGNGTPMDQSHAYANIGSPASTDSCLLSQSELSFDEQSPPSDMRDFIGGTVQSFSLLTLSDHEQLELYKAALVIQNAFRQYQGRQRQKQQELEAAVIIQNYFRRYKQVKQNFDYANFYACIQNKKMADAARVIQSRFRGYHNYKQFKKSREAAIIIQSHYRAYREQEKFRRSRHAAIVIQQRFRRLAQMKREQSAARKIQRFMKRCQNRTKNV